MRLVDEGSFEIYFEKIGEINFPNNYSEMFWQNFTKTFSRKLQKIMIGIGLLLTTQERKCWQFYK